MSTTEIHKEETPSRERARLLLSQNGALRIAFPTVEGALRQDAEWCVVKVDGEWQEIRFHDYAEVFSVPGLYEKIFYDVLKCQSPEMVGGLLQETVKEVGADPEKLRVLDLGAGNGMVGEELAQELHVEKLIGVDIIPEAAEATKRDRPGLYEDYVVTDMTDLQSNTRKELEKHAFNCLTCVAALGFGDIPPKAFAEAYNLLEPGGLVAFNIKEDFLKAGADTSGFSQLVETIIGSNVLDVHAQKRYRHRLAISGEPLYYVAITGTKNEDIPEEIIPGDG